MVSPEILVLQDEAHFQDLQRQKLEGDLQRLADLELWYRWRDPHY